MQVFRTNCHIELFKALVECLVQDLDAEFWAWTEFFNLLWANTQEFEGLLLVKDMVSLAKSW